MKKKLVEIKPDITSNKELEELKKRLIDLKTDNFDKKNHKNYLKHKIQLKALLKEISLKSKELKKIKKTKIKEERYKAKLANLKLKAPVSSEKKIFSTLLEEKIKNNNNKKHHIKVKKNFFKSTKEFPIRMFKETRRINWGKNDSKIVVKLFWVLFLVVSLALFIWGIESGLTALLKVCKIAYI